MIGASERKHCPSGSYLYIVKSGDTLWKLAGGNDHIMRRIRELNPEIHPDRLRVGQAICLPQ